MTKEEAIIALSTSPDISPRIIVKFVSLNKNCKDFSEFKKLRFPQDKRDIIQKYLTNTDFRKIKRILEQLKVQVITFFDSRYPKKLLEIPDYPAVLYCRGNINLLNEKNAVAIVGSRKATNYGLRYTFKISKELAEAGIIIVSGMAIGVDGEAHRGALEAGGRTIAVLGTAIDYLYPRSNEPLAKKILHSNSLIISEYPPGYPYFKFNFPLRNRIIAGLSDIVVVTEAAQKSGALITALLALDYNRELYALPADLGKYSSTGTNELIRRGANCLVDTAEILQRFNLDKTPAKKVLLDANEQKVLDLIVLGNDNFDKIKKSSKFSAQELNVILMNLELKGLIELTTSGITLR